MDIPLVAESGRLSCVVDDGSERDNGLLAARWGRAGGYEDRRCVVSNLRSTSNGKNSKIYKTKARSTKVVSSRRKDGWLWLECWRVVIYYFSAGLTGQLVGCVCFTAINPSCCLCSLLRLQIGP